MSFLTAILVIQENERECDELQFTSSRELERDACASNDQQIQEMEKQFITQIGQMEESHLKEISVLKQRNMEELEAKETELDTLRKRLELMKKPTVEKSDKGCQTHADTSNATAPSPINVMNAILAENAAEESGVQITTLESPAENAISLIPDARPDAQGMNYSIAGKM